ncbi:MAG: adenylate/guanylate cyclase domain-containing protein [Actinomycetota bacterium]
MQAPETRYVRRPDGVSIAYQVFGEGSIDLVCAPGLVTHLDLQWTEPGYTRFLRRLGSFARVICFDKPGTGLSDPVAYPPTLEERGDDLVRVLDAVGSERPALFGFSESGPTCVVFTAAHPERVRSLILCGSFASGQPQAERPPELSPAEFEAVTRQVVEGYSAVDEWIEHWGEGRMVDLYGPSVASPVQRRVWGTFERAAASPGLVRALIDATRSIDVTDVLPTVSVPTLVMHRTDDTAVPFLSARVLTSRIPGAKLVELPGQDHGFWFGDFDPIVDEIESLLIGTRTAREPERALATFLFTDIVRSTERAAELGDRRWADLLESHHGIVRRQLEIFRGQEVDTAGDSFLATFDGPARAIRCAQAIRDEIRKLGMEIRAGLHTGECELANGDVRGIAVHIGARVAALAGPGEILASSTVADLVAGSGLSFTERGTHHLKGVPGQWRIVALPHEGHAAPPVVDTATRMRPSDRLVVKLARRMPRSMRAAARLARRTSA